MSKQNTGKFNWNLLFPFAGVIIGCLTVSLTLSIMEGMEYAIFTKLENMSFPGKLTNINSSNPSELKKYLNLHDISFQKGIEDQILILNENEFRLVNIHGIEEFNKFGGRTLATRLDLSIGDAVIIAHTERINIFTGLPKRKQMLVGGIFDVDILDYNQKHIFCNYDLISSFIPEKQNILYLDKPLKVQLISEIKELFPEIRYKFWEENYGSFISAMKLEKYTYSISWHCRLYSHEHDEPICNAENSTNRYFTSNRDESC